jgi:hypothetical protein
MAKILLSYRRADAGAVTQLIWKELVDRYGADSVYMDIDNIPYGTDFRAHIREALLLSDVFLAIVGPNWIGADANGKSRIVDQNDPVRVEIETALQGNVTIVPVLVEHATMPSPLRLPDSLKEFPFLNAIGVDSGRDFSLHIERLFRVIDEILKSKGKLPTRLGKHSIVSAVIELVRSPVFWAVIANLSLPTLGSLFSLSPPWPRGVVLITCALASVVSIWTINALRDSTPTLVNRIVAWMAVTFVILVATYLLIVSLFTYETPTTSQYWAKGLICTVEASSVYKDKCPTLGVDELRAAEYEAERLWTPGSIAMVQIILVALWLASFAALASAIGSVLLTQSRSNSELTHKVKKLTA